MRGTRRESQLGLGGQITNIKAQSLSSLNQAMQMANSTQRHLNPSELYGTTVNYAKVSDMAAPNTERPNA